MKLIKRLPKNRSYEQIKNHYLVEKSLADKLKRSDQEERKQIYATMYDELFCKVPDHSRLTRRKDIQDSGETNKNKMSLVRKFLAKSTVFMEFAPGDCRLAMEISKHVKHVYGVDISDQRNPNDKMPDNLTLIIYDGYCLEGIKENSIDLIFSDQLIEHFHPEDTKFHFELIYRILKKGGKYVFRTPNAHTGPHDISKYFSNTPEGFHLKEWTYIELRKMIKDIGYLHYLPYWSKKYINLRIPFFYFEICEKVFSLFPKQLIRFISKLAIPSITCVAIK